MLGSNTLEGAREGQRPMSPERIHVVGVERPLELFMHAGESVMSLSLELLNPLSGLEGFRS
eukprot:2875393-Alexandrium_andersonii.AAC.1